jgi:hypothetical protein
MNALGLIADGHFLYKAEGAYGMWARIELPTLPPIPPEHMVVSPDYTFETGGDDG